MLNETSPERKALLKTIADLDRTFSEDRAEDMGKFFAPNARLMFPNMEDILGRESIQQTFVDLMAEYSTDSFHPNRELIDIYVHRAYTLGSFIEIRTPLKGGPKEKIHGRLLEIWQRSSKGNWEIIRFMTGRYSDLEHIE